MARQKSKQGICRCGKVATRTVINGITTECYTCYRERKERGYNKHSLDNSNEVVSLAVDAISKSGIDTTVKRNIKDITKNTLTTKVTRLSNGKTIVLESNPMNFFNKKREEYFMMSGDDNMIKRISGFRLTDVVDSKYYGQVLLLSEAINENNEIVCIDGIEPGEDLKGMPPATDLQIAKMLGYKDCSRKYKDCMKYLQEQGVIYKFTTNDNLVKCMDTVYFFNPIFQNNGKGVSPRLFFFFFKSFEQMAQKNKAFKARFDLMAEYSLVWLMHKRSDFKELQDKYNRNELSQEEIAKGTTKILAEVADSYGIPVRLEAKIDVDTSNMSPLEALIAVNDANVRYDNLNDFDYEDMNEDLQEEAVEDVDIELVDTDKPVVKVVKTVSMQRTVNINGVDFKMPSKRPSKILSFKDINKLANNDLPIDPMDFM